MDASEIKWNDFKLNVELHKSYLELALKFNLFYYAITGAILSFYFTQPDVPMRKYALALPIVLSLALTIFFFWAAFLAHFMRVHIRTTAAELELAAYPEGIVLVFVCAMSGAVLAMALFGLVVLFLTA